MEAQCFIMHILYSFSPSSDRYRKGFVYRTGSTINSITDSPIVLGDRQWLSLLHQPSSTSPSRSECRYTATSYTLTTQSSFYQESEIKTSAKPSTRPSKPSRPSPTNPSTPKNHPTTTAHPKPPSYKSPTKSTPKPAPSSSPATPSPSRYAAGSPGSDLPSSPIATGI